MQSNNPPPSFSLICSCVPVFTWVGKPPPISCPHAGLRSTITKQDAFWAHYRSLQVGIAPKITCFRCDSAQYLKPTVIKLLLIYSTSCHNEVLHLWLKLLARSLHAYICCYPSLTQSLSPLPSGSRWLVHCRTSEVFSREKGTVFVPSAAAVLWHPLCLFKNNILSIFYSAFILYFHLCDWHLLWMGSWLWVKICSIKLAASVQAKIPLGLHWCTFVNTYNICYSRVAVLPLKVSLNLPLFSPVEKALQVKVFGQGWLPERLQFLCYKWGSKMQWVPSLPLTALSPSTSPTTAITPSLSPSPSRGGFFPFHSPLHGIPSRGQQLQLNRQLWGVPREPPRPTNSPVHGRQPV